MSTELEEALTAAGAAPLIQKEISPVLLELERRYAPLLYATPSIKWGSNVYYFNQRTQYTPGGFVTDGGARPVGTSTYVQNQFTIRNMQAVGAVTGYAQEVTADLIGNLRATEIMGTTIGLKWDIETALCWGNSASTLYGPYPQFDGLDTQVARFTGTGQNAIDYAHAAFSLGTLDNLIDMVETNVASAVESSDWMFVVSSTVNSRVSQLLTNQQRFEQVEVAAGLIVPTYRNIPMVKTSFLAPRTNQMGTVTAATSFGGSGSLPDATPYYYRVAPVIARFGEILASAECTVTTGSHSGTNINTLSFTPPTGQDGALPVLYKVFRSGTTGTETFLGYVDAAVALAADGVTPIYANQIVDNGTQLIPQNSTGPLQPSQTPAAYVGTNVNIFPQNTGDQNIYLISRDPNFIVRPYVRDVMPVNVYPTTGSPDALPFALVTDCCLALRSDRFVGRVNNVSAQLAL